MVVVNGGNVRCYVKRGKENCRGELSGGGLCLDAVKSDAVSLRHANQRASQRRNLNLLSLRTVAKHSNFAT